MIKKSKQMYFLKLGTYTWNLKTIKNGQKYYEKSLESYKIAEDDIGEGYALRELDDI